MNKDTQGGALEFEFTLKVQKLEDQLRRVENELMGIGNVAERQGAKIDKFGGMLKNAFAGYLTFQTLKTVTSHIVSVSAEFEKMGAILENTLGSKSAANKSLENIKEFATQTPYQVTELTDSFIKLANRGIVPGMESLRSMGDFASTTGKDFGQLTEAIMDANNSERWKEFGVQVETVGDKVKLSFKNQTIEVENSAAGALKAIESFSKLQGVQGTMAAVMKTTNGEMSNLEDGLDNLSNIIGTRMSGATKGLIRGLQTVVKTLTDWVEIPLADKIGEEQIELNKLILQLTDVNTSETDRKKIIEEIQKNYPDFINNIDLEKASNEELIKTLDKTNEAYINRIVLAKVERELAKETGKADDIREKKLKQQGDLLESVANLTVFINQKKKEGFQIDSQLLESTKNNEERVNALATIMDDLQSQGVDISGFAEPLNTLQQNIRLLDQKLEKQEAIADAVRKERDMMKSLLGITDEPDKPAGSPGDGNSDKDPDKSLKDFEKYLKEQKDLYEKFENAKLVYGEKKAKEQFSNLLSSYREFLLQMRKQYQNNPAFAGIVATELAPIFKEEQLEEIPRIEAFWEKQKAVNLHELTLTKKITKEQQDKLKYMLAQAEAGGKLSLFMYKISDTFSMLSSKIGNINEDIAKTAETIAVVSEDIGILNSSNSSSTDKITSVISLITVAIEKLQKAFSGLDKSEENYNSMVESFEAFNRSLEVQLQYIETLAGDEKLGAIRDRLEEIGAKAEKLEASLPKGLSVINADKDLGNFTDSEYVLKATELINMLNKDLAKGGLPKATMQSMKDDIAVLNELIKLKNEYDDKMQSLYVTVTGTTRDSITDAIVQGFQNGYSAVEDFGEVVNNTFEAALVQGFKSKFLESQISAWYNEFGKAAEGGYTPDEIAALELSMNKYISDASTGWAELQKMFDNIDFAGSIEKSSLSGAISGMSEQTADVLAGTFNAIRLIQLQQTDIQRISMAHLRNIDTNTSYNKLIYDIIRGNRTDTSAIDLAKKRAKGI